MILHVTAQGLGLDDPSDLKSYKVQVDGPESERDSVVAAHPQLRRVDAGHVAVPQETLRSLAGGLASEPEWLSNFAKMVSYASSKGWVTEAGEIIGHIE